MAIPASAGRHDISDEVHGVGLMADVPAWYWQVLGAVFGLGLGLFLGAVRRRNGAKSRPPTPPAQARPVRSDGPAPAAAPAGDATQQRLLERLREANLDLTAKLRAATDLHAREMLDRSQQQQGDLQRHERQLEDLRQAHAAELSHLMTLMVEQVDGMQRDHANQLRALETELERTRRMFPSEDTSMADATRPVTVMVAGDMNPSPGAHRPR
jgi:hypothetical protein